LPRIDTGRHRDAWGRLRRVYAIERIKFIASETLLGKTEGGRNEDDEYFDLIEVECSSSLHRL
jgi:hypothetical protein